MCRSVLWSRITLMRIRIRIRMRIRIQLITLMRIRMWIRILIFIWCGSGFESGSGSLLDADPYPDPTFHTDAKPDPVPSFQIKAPNLFKKCWNRLIFNTYWLVICKIMRIRIRFRIQLITLMRIRILIFIWCGSGCGSGFLFDANADPGADSCYKNDADPEADPGPQHCRFCFFDVDRAIFMFRLVKRRKRRRVWYSKLRLCEGCKRISMTRNHTARWVTGFYFLSSLP